MRMPSPPPRRPHRGRPKLRIVGDRRKRFDWFKVVLVALPLAGASAVLLWDGVPQASALPFMVAAAPAGSDRESASFARCYRGTGWTCVVDGDTIHYQGEIIRIADINTPETHEASCDSERALGERATARLQALLNEGPFTLEPVDRDTDRYGRSLRTITRQGESLGDVLVEEGLAERWKGYRREWC